MKRKLMGFGMMIAIFILGIFALFACGGNSINGTYYLYQNGVMNKSNYIILDGGTWTNHNGDSSDYSISGENITIYYTDFMGGKVEYTCGTVKDGTLTLHMGGETVTYYKEGYEPADRDHNENQPAIQYIVTYDANGGTFLDGRSIFTQEVNSGSKLTTPAAPTRTKYTFAGWAKNKSGLEMWNFEENAVSANTTLYAQWSQESASLLSVDGATIDGENILMIVSNETDSVNLTDKVVCSNDSIWSLCYDNLGQREIFTKVAAGVSGTLTNGDNIFYIVVTTSDRIEVRTYTLTIHKSYVVEVIYMVNDTNYETKQIFTGTTLTDTYNIECQIKGYTFHGWKGTITFGEIVYDSVEFTADLTANNYQLTLDPNNGSEIDKIEVSFDSEYVLPVPSRTGYTFLGWYIDNSKLTDEKGNPYDVWKIDRNATATAQWQANLYTLTLNCNNNLAGKVSGGGDHKYHSQVTLIAKTNSGYTWVGWFDSNDELVSAEQQFSIIMELDSTYTAKWCKVRLNRNNQYAGFISSLNSTYNTGEEITISATVNIGFYWLGWYCDDVLLTNEMSFTFAMPSEDITYTAKWGVDVSYIDSNGKLSHYTDDNLKTPSVTGDQILSGWYVFSGIVTGEFTLTVNGEAHIILIDKSEWTVGEIRVLSNHTLHIYSQSVGDNVGELLINGNLGGINGNEGRTGDTIGGKGSDGSSGGTIIINGGVISATNIGGGNGGRGGGAYYSGYNGGIGGHGGSGGTIIINGGIVSATNIGGGNGGQGGGGTYGGTQGRGGNGGEGGTGGDSGTITINGGIVSATNIGGGCGGEGGDAGGGGKKGSKGGSGGRGGYGGRVNIIIINGGTISTYNIGGGIGGIGGHGVSSNSGGGSGGYGGSGGAGGKIMIGNSSILTKNIGGGLGGKGGISGYGSETGSGGNGGNGSNGANAMIYYIGTPSAWNNKNVESINADIYFYSATTPSEAQWNESSNWWHYDYDCEIEIWTRGN